MKENFRERFPKLPRRHGNATNQPRYVKNHQVVNEPFQEVIPSSYVDELEQRLKISESIAVGSDEKGTTALLFDKESGCFTVLQKDFDQDEANIFDTLSRDQWGGTVLVIGHKRQGGTGYIASGHISIKRSNLRMKFANGRIFDCEIDPETPCLLPYHMRESPKSAPPSVERAPKSAFIKTVPVRKNGPNGRTGQYFISATNPTIDNEAENFTEEDLQRLRGEISFESSSQKSTQQRNRFR